MTKDNALSTKFAEDYKIKEEPKNIKIEIGSSYLLSDGSGGTRQVTVVSIRKINEEIIIYFKWRLADANRYGEAKHSIWNFLIGGSWRHDQRTLQVFKNQLLQYGELKEIEIVYNDTKLNVVNVED